jgi:hypothetical protein
LHCRYFMSMMDMFKSEKKNALCKKLLLSFVSSPDTTADPVIIHTVFDLARNLHDSIDALTFSDERQQISDLVCHFVEKIDFGRDLEQQLHVCVCACGRRRRRRRRRCAAAAVLLLLLLLLLLSSASSAHHHQQQAHTHSCCCRRRRAAE